jgi:hypothetical protein
MCDNCVKSYSSWNAFFCWLTAFGYSNNQREATLLQNVKSEKQNFENHWHICFFTAILKGRKILTCCKFLQFKLIFYKFDEKRARTPRWVIRFTSKLQVKKKMDRRVELPDTFLEENHPMTISSKCCSWPIMQIRKKGGWNLKKSSPLKLLSQSQPNFAEMILEWSSSKIVSGISEHRPRWPSQPNLI